MATPVDSRRAFDYAARALSSRDRTVAEMRAFLERKRVEPAMIDEVVADLTETGTLDDADYARRFAEDKRSLAGWGSQRIERELERRGVAANHIDAAVGALGTDNERRTALDLLTQRFPRGCPDDRERDRAWRLLVRRGFEPDLSYEVIRAHERGLGEAA
ncbi:MAG: RecX family transcriptional regulator [Thermoleophilaceae bacterium]|nr:RecX family transcriptional regulator [Thermoleophilaceae bacterium]